MPHFSTNDADERAEGEGLSRELTVGNAKGSRRSAVRSTATRDSSAVADEADQGDTRGTDQRLAWGRVKAGLCNEADERAAVLCEKWKGGVDEALQPSDREVDPLALDVRIGLG